MDTNERIIAHSKLRYSIMFEILWPITKIFVMRFWVFPAMLALSEIKVLRRLALKWHPIVIRMDAEKI